MYFEKLGKLEKVNGYTWFLVTGQYAEAECRYSLERPNVIPAVKVMEALSFIKSAHCVSTTICKFVDYFHIDAGIH